MSAVEHHLCFRMNVMLLKIIHKVFLLFGLAPYKASIEVSPPEGASLRFKLSPSRIGCAYNLLLIIIIIGIMIAVVQEIIAMDYGPAGPLGKSIDIALLVMGNIFAVITILTYCVHQQILINLGNDLSEFLENYGLELFSQPKILRNTFHVGITILFFSLFTISLMTLQMIIYESIWFYSYVVCVVFSSCFILQYSLIIKILKDSMEGINEAVRRLDCHPTAVTGNSFFSAGLMNCRSILRKLADLRRARNHLCKISKRIADFHALPSLLIIFYCCCHSVDLLYYLVIKVIDRRTYWVNMMVLNNALWTVFIMGPIVILSETVKRFNDEKETTADVVYDVREMYEASKEITSELSDFGIELLHRKVVFTAYGFFSLDCTLLYSIFGMVATYLIILLQFRPSEVPAL